MGLERKDLGWRNAARRCRPRSGQRRLCGLVCIAAGVLVLVCFLPEWVLAVGCALVLFAIGGKLF